MKAVEDGLRRLDGVDQIRIDLQTNVVTITPDGRREYDLRRFPQAIRDSGFKPGAMRIRARGDVDSGGRFRIAGWRRWLDVAAPGRLEEGQGVRIVARVDWERGGALRILDLAPPVSSRHGQ